VFTLASNNARLRGPKFESDLVRWLRARGWDAERLRMAGKDDQGDIVVRDGDERVILEAKAAVRFDLAGWMAETLTEKANYAKARGLDAALVDGYLVVKAPGRPIGEAYVIQHLKDVFPDEA
jgi:Holliday junction resolvase